MQECRDCNGDGYIPAVSLAVPYLPCDECNGTGAQQATPTDCEVWAMMSEPTGVHMLDSGGDGGRHWQRVASLSVADALALPEATADQYGVTVDAFHYVRRRVESIDPHHRAALEWERIAEELRDEPWLECGAAFADWVREQDGEASDEWNTYNWATALNRTLQGFGFTLPGERRAYVWLQSHNGADVRGGYSTPHIFALRYSDERTTAEYADLYLIADANDYTLDCEDCGLWVAHRAGDIYDSDGCPVDPDASALDYPYPCQGCGKSMTANAPEPGSL